jgi:putative toxin-antitoxin system antitoxin component (TIGR02293 family)
MPDDMEAILMITEQKIASVLGGQTSLGRKIKSTLDMDKLIREGFPYKAGNHVRGLLNLSLPLFAGIIEVSERTLARVRKSPNQRLPTVASDRLYRLARIFSIACEVLEDEEKAKEWIRRSQVGLGGKTPLDLLHTEAGAKEVENLLWRIEYGIIS